MRTSSAALIVVLFVFLGLFSIPTLTTPPIRMAVVWNDELILRQYYDYRKEAKVITYFAEIQGGEPNGKLYAVELAGDKKLSRNAIIQFSPAGVYDFNPGTWIKTLPADSGDANSYCQAFAEVRAKYETQKWWDRVLFFH